MSTFEQYPLTGPLPEGALPASPPRDLPVVAVPVPAVSVADIPAPLEAHVAPAEVPPAVVPVQAAPPVALAAVADVQPVPEPEPELDTEPESAPESASVTPRRLVTTRLAASLLTVVLLAVVALAGAFAYEQRAHQQNQAVAAARSQAMATVKQAAPLLLSYDYRSLDKDFAAAIAFTGGEFKKQYTQTTSTVVAPVATQYKAVVRAELIEVGVSSASADQVVVVAFVNQVTTSTRVTGTKLDQSRVRMELRRVGADWKIVLVQAL